MDSAVIFDVDGVLLDLTPEEEDAFFLPFARRHGITGLSRDWNSYRIRNDERIIAELLETHRLPPGESVSVISDYLEILSGGISGGSITVRAIPGAAGVLRELSNSHRLGIATANLLAAARIRLAACDLWHPVASLAFGAEGSGHKRETVARAMAAAGLPKHRIVYVGDNLNDVEAGLSNGVHFIGFSEDGNRREALRRAGALHLSGDHATTRALISQLIK
jgi:phosphoglycolate phosphatase-like HAD superfamily hydrolase